MARGQEEKLIVINKIKEVFPEAFEYDKTIRIPIGDVQIKVALTAAKVNVGPGEDSAVPGLKATKVTIAGVAEPVFEETRKSTTQRHSNPGLELLMKEDKK